VLRQRLSVKGQLLIRVKKTLYPGNYLSNLQFAACHIKSTRLTCSSRC